MCFYSPKKGYFSALLYCYVVDENENQSKNKSFLIFNPQNIINHFSEHLIIWPSSTEEETMDKNLIHDVCSAIEEEQRHPTTIQH